MSKEISQEVENILREISELPRMRDLDLEKVCIPEGYAEKIAKEFGDLKPTQLRKVFHELKRIERDVKKKGEKGKFEYTRVAKLLPHLAYAKGRQLIPEKFYQMLKMCLDKQKLEINEDFLRLAEFVTAILAYHKSATERRRG